MVRVQNDLYALNDRLERMESFLESVFFRPGLQPSIEAEFTDVTTPCGESDFNVDTPAPEGAGESTPASAGGDEPF